MGGGNSGPGMFGIYSYSEGIHGFVGGGYQGRGISAIGGWQWGRGRGSRPRLHEGRLFAGITEGGRGPRMREDKEREGWVVACARRTGGCTPIPRLHGGRISTRGQGGEGRQDFSTPLRCARNDMCEVGKEDGDGFPPRREQRRERWVPVCGDLCITTETHSDSGVGRLLP